MSLKDLVNNARKTQLGRSKAKTGGNNAGKDFNTIEYNLNFRTPKRDDLKTILQGILSTLESGTGEIDTTTMKPIIMQFYRLALSQDARAQGVFHPSEISTEGANICTRKMYYQKGRVKKDATYVNFTNDNRMMRLVDLGTMLHLYLQENLDRAGVLKDFEVDVVAPEYGITGKMDGVVEFMGEDDLGVFYDKEDMALEIKSINEYGFKALRRAKPDHLKQATIYGGTLGYKRILFLYINKNTSAIKLFVHDIDQKYLKEIQTLTGGIVQLFNKNARAARSKDVAKHSNIPNRVCQNALTKRAMDCYFKDYCFGSRNSTI